MRIRSLVAIATLLGLAVGVHAADLGPMHADLFKRYLSAMASRPGGDYRSGLYPSEEAIFFLSGWMLTGDDACLKAAQTQLNVSHSWVDRNGVFDGTPSGEIDKVSRDASARHIYNYYVAYRVLGDPKMLVHVDRCADAMMQYLKREPFVYKGQTFTLFDVVYEPRKPYKPASGTTIDANQNAELGLTFTLLYHEPASKWFHNETVRDIALSELRASMAVQNMQTGAIAIGSSPEWRDKYDTTYGCYTLFSWVWANRLWQDDPLMVGSDFGIHIRRACDWLDPAFDGDTRSVHWYPAHSVGQLDTEQVWHALPGFYDQGRDLRRLWGLYEASVAKADGSGLPSWLCGQAYLYVMGMPAEVLKASGLPAKWLPVEPVVKVTKAKAAPSKAPEAAKTPTATGAAASGAVEPQAAPAK
jgi:hypothetical protein